MQMTSKEVVQDVKLCSKVMTILSKIQIVMLAILGAIIGIIFILAPELAVAVFLAIFCLFLWLFYRLYAWFIRCGRKAVEAAEKGDPSPVRKFKLICLILGIVNIPGVVFALVFFWMAYTLHQAEEGLRQSSNKFVTVVGVPMVPVAQANPVVPVAQAPILGSLHPVA